MAVVTYCETPYWVQTYSDGHTNVLWGSPVCWTDTLMTETPDSNGNGDGGTGNPPFDPKVVKNWLYKNFQKKINDCIKAVFKEDAGKIPVQIRANAPILDATKNIEQIKQITGRAGWGTNNPNRGKYGTVYVASEVYTSQESYAGLAIAGAFVHELGNILDAKIFPMVEDG